MEVRSGRRDREQRGRTEHARSARVAIRERGVGAYAFDGDRRTPEGTVGVAPSAVAIEEVASGPIAAAAYAQVDQILVGTRWCHPSSALATPPEEIANLPGYREAKDEDIAEAQRLMAEAGFGAPIHASVDAILERLAKKAATPA